MSIPSTTPAAPAATPRALAALLAAAALLSGCGETPTPAGIPPALLQQARPIGSGPRFYPPPARSVSGRCARTLGTRTAAHVELFAANRVVIVPAGIGVGRPRQVSAGRIVAARCYGALVTLEPTGVVLASAGAHMTLADLFAAWNQALSARRLASFAAPVGGRVAVFVDGRRRWGAPGSVPLTEHAEIVLEVGPHVPPHSSFTFPPGV
ncbi:MAG TPA: hypothetical protein VNV42_13805 [Solirubrobacteraceae bacterium]|nr:hypothetical protein [Solirubrobacteraceae bacterium]